MKLKNGDYFIPENVVQLISIREISNTCLNWQNKNWLNFIVEKQICVGLFELSDVLLTRRLGKNKYSYEEFYILCKSHFEK